MYDDIATLKAYTTTGADIYGNPITTEVDSVVYVQPRSVYASEFYQAAQNGIKPTLSLFIANRLDYSGEKIVEYKGIDYDVIRVDWNAQRDGITLVCEERVGNEKDPGGGSA